MSFEVKEILALPDKEKKRIADLIYESLQNKDDSNILNEPLPEWQQKILIERLDIIDKHPERLLSKEEAKKRIQQLMKK